MRVFGFDLRTGERTRSYKPDDFAVPDERITDSACTLTASGGLLYARIGATMVRPPEAINGITARESLLVCLEPRADDQLVELWRVRPPEDDKTAAAWEGAPLVSGRRLWAVYAKFEGGRTIHVAACYDPADTHHTPARPVWTAELCDSPQPIGGIVTARQELLTLAGRQIVFCSNSGAVIALDAATGRRSWGFRYPRSRKAINSATIDPAPAVAYGGRVFLAPADGDRVYALDAETGRLVWESGHAEGARILGVSRNRLIITVTDPVRGIRGLNLDTGSHTTNGGWVQHTDSGLLSYGQGLVTDDVIIWPSRQGLYFLNPENGRPDRGSPNPIPSLFNNCFGNLAYADGSIVVVTPAELWCFKAPSRKIEIRPDTPPRTRFDAMIDRAEHALATGHSARAMTLFAEVAESDLPLPFRTWAAARMLQLAPPATAFNQLPVEVRNAVRAPLLTEWILSPQGIPVTLDTFLQRHLGGQLPQATVPIANAVNHKRCVPELTADAVIDRTRRCSRFPERADHRSVCSPPARKRSWPSRSIKVRKPRTRRPICSRTPRSCLTASWQPDRWRSRCTDRRAMRSGSSASRSPSDYRTVPRRFVSAATANRRFRTSRPSFSPDRGCWRGWANSTSLRSIFKPVGWRGCSAQQGAASTIRRNFLAQCDLVRTSPSADRSSSCNARMVAAGS
jgi:hypothetical protein